MIVAKWFAMAARITLERSRSLARTTLSSCVQTSVGTQKAISLEFFFLIAPRFTALAITRLYQVCNKNFEKKCEGDYLEGWILRIRRC